MSNSDVAKTLQVISACFSTNTSINFKVANLDLSSKYLGKTNGKIFANDFAANSAGTDSSSDKFSSGFDKLFLISDNKFTRVLTLESFNVTNFIQ